MAWPFLVPGQVFSFDRNEGAGFWWVNSFNAFMRNVAVECDQYGFRYDARRWRRGFRMGRSRFGARMTCDVRWTFRTLPFLRSRRQRKPHGRIGATLYGGVSTWGVACGVGAVGGVGDAGPDKGHPFVIRGLRVWESHWAFSPAGCLGFCLMVSRSRAVILGCGGRITSGTPTAM